MSRPRRHHQVQMVICRQTVATRKSRKAVAATTKNTGIRGTRRTTCHHLVLDLVFGLDMVLVRSISWVYCATSALCASARFLSLVIRLSRTILTPRRSNANRKRSACLAIADEVFERDETDALKRESQEDVVVDLTTFPSAGSRSGVLGRRAVVGGVGAISRRGRAETNRVQVMCD